MNVFERYQHINDLFEHYCRQENSDEVITILESGPKSDDEAAVVAKFAWLIAEFINSDEENEIEVMGSTDNTEMIPDLSYEVSLYLKSRGFYHVWQKVSKEAMT